MSVIDNRVVMMQFNNKDFEKNAKQTLGTLDKLKMALNFGSVKNSLQDLAGVSSKGFAIVASSVQEAQKKVDVFEQMAIGALRRLGDQAAQTGRSFVKSLSIDQISSGFQKYETEVASVQTIMNATGKSIEDVQKQLDKLMWFTDETSYSFSDMVANIGKFTSSGVSLEPATEAMMGISNWAAFEGRGVSEASRAMYNLSQSMGLGYVQLLDWNSIVQAGMASPAFKKRVIDNAVALGTLKKVSDGLYETLENHEVTVTNFNDSLSDRWFTSDVLLKTLRQYNEYTEEVYRIVQEEGVSAAEAMEIIGDSFEGFGEQEFKAGQEAKTFTDAINAIKDAVSSGWEKSFDLIFGNYIEAKWMWTELANLLWDTFASGGAYRNEQLTIWRDDFDGRTKLVESFLRLIETFNYRLEHFKESLEAIFGNPWDAKNLASISEKLVAFTDKIVNTQHITDRFNRNIAPIVKGFKVLATGVGRIAESLAKYVREFVTGFVNNDIFSPKTEYAINNVASSIIRFASSLKTDGDTLQKFSELGDTAAKVLGQLLTALKDILTVGGKTFSDVFGKPEVLFVIQKILGWISERVGVITQAFKRNDRGKRILTGLLSLLKAIGAAIAGIITAVRPVIDKTVDYNLPRFAEFLAVIGDLLSKIDYAAVFVAVNTAVTQCLKPIQQAAKFIKGVWEWTRKLADMLSHFVGRVSATNGMQALNASFETLGLSVKGIFGASATQETAEAGTSFEWVITAIEGALNGLIPVFDCALGFFADIIDKLPSVTELFKSFLNLFHNEEGSGALDFFERLGQGITNIFEDLDIPALIHNAGEWFSGVMQGFAEGLSEIKWEDIRGIGFIIGLIFTLIKLHTLEKKAENILTTVFALPTSVAGFVKGLTGVVDGVKGLFENVGEAAKMMAQTHQITALAAALSALVLALAVLAIIPKEDMARAVVYLGIIALILKLLSKDGNMLNHIDTSSTVNHSNNNTIKGNINILNSATYGWAAIISSLVGFALAMVYVFKQLSELQQVDEKAISTGLTTIAIMLGLIAAFVVIMGLVSKTLGQTYKSNTKFGKGAYAHYKEGSTVLPPGMVGMLLALTATIVFLTGVIKSLGSMSSGDFAQGMLGLTAIFGLLIAFTAAMALASYELNKQHQNSSTNAAKAMLLMAVSLTIISGAVLALIPSIAALAVIGHFTDIWGPILAIGTIIAAMAGLMTLVMNNSVDKGWNPKGLLIVAASFAILAVAMDILIPALATLGIMAGVGSKDNNVLLSSIMAFVAILAAMGAALSIVTAIADKVGGASVIIKISAAFLLLALAMVAAGAALSVFSANEDWEGFKKFAAVLGTLVLAVGLIAAVSWLLSFIPGAAMILEGLAMVLGGMALVFIAFAGGMWILSKALPPLTEAIPPFVAALETLFEFISEHWLGITLTVLGLVVLAAILGVTLGLIIKYCGGFFTAIGTLLSNAKTKFDALPAKTKTFITTLVIGIAAGLAAATPEIIDKIGGIIVKVLNFLGQLAAPIVDGLLQLLISIVFGLADAIRNNSGALIVALVDVAEALLEVIMDAIFAVFNGLDNLNEMIIGSMREAGGIWGVIADAIDFFDFSDKIMDNARIGFDDMKSFLRQGTDEVADALGVDLERFGKNASGGISDVVGTIKESAKQDADTGIADVLAFADEKLSNVKPFDITKKADFTSLIPEDMFSTDTVTNALGNIQLSADGMSDGVASAFGDMANFSGMSMDDVLANSDTMMQGLETDGMGISDMTANIWGDYADTVSDGSEDAREAVEGDIEGTLSYMNNKSTSFWQAGVNMMQGLQNGLDYQFQFVKGSIVAKANQLINVFEREQQIESPSKVWAGLGGYMMLGLARGIEDQANDAVAAVSYVASVVNAALTNDSEYQPTIRPVVDMSMVSGAAGTVRGFFAGQSVQLAGINGRLDMQAADLRAQMDQNRIYNDANVVASISGLRDDVNALNGAMSNMQVVMDTGAVVGATAAKMDQALYQRSVFKGRGN